MSREVIINSTHNKPTFSVFWYPVNPNMRGNVYEEGGILHKYDQAFGTNTRGYEIAHNTRNTSWEGHCHASSMVACLLQEPRRSVTYNGITFNTEDIKGLLVKIIQALPFDIKWIGKRYPEGEQSEPRPRELYEQLKQWSSLKLPVIFDVERDTPVWNYPMDKVVFDFGKGQMEITSVGFPAENRTFRFDWNRNDWTGEIQHGRSANVDFAWCVVPRGDLTKLESFPVENSRRMNPWWNPDLSPRKIGEIYLRSINVVREEPRRRREDRE